MIRIHAICNQQKLFHECSFRNKFLENDCGYSFKTIAIAFNDKAHSHNYTLLHVSNKYEFQRYDYVSSYIIAVVSS